MGWFIVSNGSQKLINFSANMDSKSSVKKPIESMVADFSRYSEYDAEMIKHPVILKTFLQSKYEEEATDIPTEDIIKSDNRLLGLFGTSWGIDFKDIQCPFYVYNGVDDTGCVPNMASFVFESVTGKKALKIDVDSNDDIHDKKGNEDENDPLEQDDSKNNADLMPKPVGSMEVDVKEDIDDDNELIEDEIKEDPASLLTVEDQVMECLQKEFETNESLSVNNKQSKLVWGSGKGHLWFFEQELWRDIVYRVIFIEKK